MKCPIFISYKRVNKAAVFDVVKKIEQRLGVKCWVDLDGLESNVQFASRICDAIDNSDVFLFMHSSAHLSIDYETDYTIKELNYAMAAHKKIVLVKLDDAPLKNVFLLEFGSKNYRDCRDNDQLDRLVSDLHEWLNIPHSYTDVKGDGEVGGNERAFTYEMALSHAQLWQEITRNPDMSLLEMTSLCESKSLDAYKYIEKLGSGTWSRGRYALRLKSYPLDLKLGSVKAVYMVIGNPNIRITQIKKIFDAGDGILVSNLSRLHAECMQYLLREHNIQTEILVV